MTSHRMIERDAVVMETAYNGVKYFALDRQQWENWVASCATRHRRL